MEVSLIIFSATEYLKESNLWMRQNMPDSLQKSMATFINFTKEKVLNNNKEHVQVLDNYLRKPDDALIRDELSNLIQSTLDNKPRIKQNYESLVEQLKRIEEKNVELQSRLDEIVVEIEEMRDDTPGMQNRFDTIIDELEEIKKNSSLMLQAQEEYEKSEKQSSATAKKRRTRIIVSERGRNLILVPYDFSQISEYALLHAINFARRIEGPVSLVHIVKKEREIAKAKARLETVAEETFNKHQIRPGLIIRSGNIFTTITDITFEHDAKLVVMGTHGMKGLQRLTGSWALKVIADSVAPFLVVQAPPASADIRKVMFPVDYRSEMKQKLNQAVFLAEYFETKFHITKPATIGNEALMKRTSHNMKFVQRYFKQRSIDYEINTVEDTRDFFQASIRYLDYAKPDMALIVTTKNIGIQDYLVGAEEQKLIANSSKIPVLCVNPIYVQSRNFSSSPGFMSNL